MAQPGSAPALGAGGPEFEPRRPRPFDFDCATPAWEPVSPEFRCHGRNGARHGTRCTAPLNRVAAPGSSSCWEPAALAIERGLADHRDERAASRHGDGRSRSTRSARAGDAQWGRAPTDRELQGLIDEAVREEILYREAVRLSLDRDDADRAPPARAEDDVHAGGQLRRFRRPRATRGGGVLRHGTPSGTESLVRTTFRHVFLSGGRRADPRRRRGGAAARAPQPRRREAGERAGDRFPLLREYADRTDRRDRGVCSARTSRPR